MMRTVLVVDDKEMMRDSVATTLQRAGFTVLTAPDGTQGLDLVAKKRPDAVVTDMRMPGLSGMELLEKIREIDDELPVVLMTAFGTIETAVKAMKMGAFDYLTKPFEGDELIITVKRAVEHRRLVRENAVLRMNATPGAPGSTGTGGTSRQEPKRTGLDRLIGGSGAMRQLRDQLQAIADSGGTVLVTGESGSGKEVVAQAIHEMTARSAGPFLAVNCAALSENLLESELFGHERGSFTGAERLRKGRFELADGGTLLLDEVSEVSPKIQAKLLRVLQERAFERVGSSLTIGVDVRIIATSNRDLPKSVAANEFRQDLYYRLNVLPVAIPPLRARLEDVPVLAEHFIAEICAREGRTGLKIEPSALEVLASYQWPGNVRELQNICERAVVLAPRSGDSGGLISRTMIEPWLSGKISPATSMIESKMAPAAVMPPMANWVGDRTLEEIEREAIVQTLERFKGHRQKTAKALGIGVRTLGLKLKKWKGEQLVGEEV